MINKAKIAKKKGAKKSAGDPGKRPPTAPDAREAATVPAADGPPAAAAAAIDKTWQPGPDEVGIRVRMYRVGFGDFFLLSYMQDSGVPVHVIIDCGVFKGTSQTGDIGSIEAAVAHMANITDGQIALIIVTHRHADHIAGFARCSDVFEKLRVGAVWMSIWESEYSATAAKFQSELTNVAQRLNQHFSALGVGASEESQTARKYMENALGVAGAGSNNAALEVLKRKLGVVPAYYQGGDTPKLPDALEKSGVQAKILGPPPVRDLDLMKLMDLQKGVGQYLTEEGEASDELCVPFGPEWEFQSSEFCDALTTADFGALAFREWVERRSNSVCITEQQARSAQAHMEKVLQQSQPIAALTAAKQLNSFLNNQSLVILFSFKGKTLLFAGDAQAGNWEHWLFAADSPDKKAGGKIEQSAKDILTSLDFYKVGHHGSSNATPKPAVQAMGVPARKFVSLCSTQAGVYGTEDPDDPSKGTEVPRIPLLNALGEKSAVVRSDQIPITVNGKTVKAAVPAPLPPSGLGYRFIPGDLWLDCYL
jgi:hypothetical protein